MVVKHFKHLKLLLKYSFRKTTNNMAKVRNISVCWD